MGCEEVVELIEEVEFGVVVQRIVVGEHQVHLLYLQVRDMGLANDDIAALTLLYHLLDEHQGVCGTLMEYIQGMLTDVSCNAVGYLFLPRLPDETPTHQPKGFLEVVDGVVLQELRKVF